MNFGMNLPPSPNIFNSPFMHPFPFPAGNFLPVSIGTTSPHLGMSPINILNSKKIVTPIQNEPPKKATQTLDTSERTTVMLKQIHTLIQDLNQKITDLTTNANAEALNSVQKQLQQLSVHYAAFQHYINQREQARTILETQLANLKKQLQQAEKMSKEASRGDDRRRKPLLDNKTDELLASRALSLMGADEASSDERPLKKHRYFSDSSDDDPSSDSEAEASSSVSDDEIQEKPRRSKASVPLTAHDATQYGSLDISKKRRSKLPESAIVMLKNWILDHREHPYPTEEEKAVMCQQTGLTMNQINNWFTNARRRFLTKLDGQAPGVAK